MSKSDGYICFSPDNTDNTKTIKLGEEKDRPPCSFRRKRPFLSLKWVFDSDELVA